MSVQVEHGFTRIANKLYDAIILTDFSKNQLKIVHAIIRNSYGFGRKDCDASVAFLASKTGIDKAAVSRTITSLIKLKVCVVVQKASFNSPRKIMLQKEYKKWKNYSPEKGLSEKQLLSKQQLLSKEGLSKQQQLPKQHYNSCQNDNTTVVKTTTMKENFKENFKETKHEHDHGVLVGANLPEEETTIRKDFISIFQRQPNVQDIRISQDLISQYGMKEWRAAIRKAYENGKMNHAYIRGILRNEKNGTYQQTNSGSKQTARKWQSLLSKGEDSGEL